MDALRYYGPKLSDINIKRKTERLTEMWRYLNKGSIENIDILDIVEFKLDFFAPGFSFAVVTSDHMMKLLGASCDKDISIAFTDLSVKVIYASENLYDDAYNGDGWARVQLAHELGHAVLHSDYKDRTAHFSFKYKSKVNSIIDVRIRDIPLYRDNERQADIFARCLMAPDYIVELCNSAYDLSNRAGIDFLSASARWKFFSDEKAGKTPIFSIRSRQ